MSGTSISDKDFEQEVLQSSSPVMVDFWAEWCPPCRALSPIVDEVAKEMAGKVKIVKINIDNSPATASHYGVSSIPTLMIFKDGKLQDTRVGALPKSQLSSWLNSFVS